MQKIFGIGWVKTGTTTLGECFKLLGFNHEGSRLDLVGDLERGDLTRIFEIASTKQTFEDWPWIILFKELDQRFPGSKFILTYRDPEKQYQSYQNMVKTRINPTEAWQAIRRTLYGLPFPNVTEDQIKLRYLRHNSEVINHFRSRPEALLIVNWEAGDGWQELCDFLGIPVPAIPFPHANRGSYA